MVHFSKAHCRSFPKPCPALDVPLLLPSPQDSLEAWRVQGLAFKLFQATLQRVIIRIQHGMEAFSKGFEAPNNPFPNRVPGVRVLAAFGPCCHKHVVLQGIHAAEQSTPRKHQEGIPVLELNTIPMQKQRELWWTQLFSSILALRSQSKSIF